VPDSFGDWAPRSAGRSPIKRARVRQFKAAQVAALASFDSVILTALKETEQAPSTYRATLDNRQDLVDAQANIHRSFDIAREECAAGSLSALELLTAEQSLVAFDAAVAATAMPSFGAAYTDAEIAAVANYVITHSGGKQGQVMAKAVADARP